MCGELPDPDWFLAQQVRVATVSNNEARLEQVSDNIVRAPKYVVVPHGKPSHTFSADAKEKMYPHVGLASLSAVWETNKDPLLWIRDEACKIVANIRRPDTADYRAQTRSGRRRVEIDTRESGAIEIDPDQVVTRASLMNDEVFEQLCRSVRDTSRMTADAKAYFDLYYSDRLQFDEIIVLTGWERKRAKNAYENMRRHLAQVERIRQAFYSSTDLREVPSISAWRTSGMPSATVRWEYLDAGTPRIRQHAVDPREEPLMLQERIPIKVSQ